MFKTNFMSIPINTLYSFNVSIYFNFRKVNLLTHKISNLSWYYFMQLSFKSTSLLFLRTEIKNRRWHAKLTILPNTLIKVTLLHCHDIRGLPSSPSPTVWGLPWDHSSSLSRRQWISKFYHVFFFCLLISLDFYTIKKYNMLLI